MFNLDADEGLNADALAGIRALAFDSLPQDQAFRFLRRNCIAGHEVRHGDWAGDKPLRLFNRTVHDFDENVVHESVPVKGDCRNLPGHIKHYCYRDYADVFRLDYHRRKAKRWYAQRSRRSAVDSRWPSARASFLRCYCFRLGFLDGRAGVIVALSVAVNAALGLAMASDGQVDDRVTLLTVAKERGSRLRRLLPWDDHSDQPHIIGDRS